MSDKKILCVGLMCVDLIQVCQDFPVEDSDQRSTEHRWQRGGNASNNCTVLARCGQACEYFGTVGDDLLAKYAQQDFEYCHINTKNIVKFKNQDSPFSSVIINAKNGSRTIIHSNKNMPELTLEDFRKLNLHQYHWVHFEGRNVPQVVLMLKDVLAWNAKHTPIKTSVELEKPKEDLKSLLPLADVVFIGKDFALFQGCKNKQEALKRNVEFAKPSGTVVVAWGESGAIGQTSDGNVVTSAAFQAAHVVDTLGAGDTFVAVSILCLSRGQHLQESITAACRVAGAKVEKTGFTAIHPGLLQVDSRPTQ